MKFLPRLLLLRWATSLIAIASAGWWLHLLSTSPNRQARAAIDSPVVSPADKPLESTEFDARRFGAKADGTTNDAAAIQSAIDHCADAGGGHVLLRGGTFLSGSVHLRSHVHLRIEPGAVLLGSPRREDYPLNPPPLLLTGTLENPLPTSRPSVLAPQEPTVGENRALVYAGGCDDVGIHGGGEIDGNGASPGLFDEKPDLPGRPRCLLFVSCTNVTVENLFLHDSAFWMQYYLGCQHVRVKDLRVRNHSNWNNDGIDVESTDVIVNGCDFDVDDDAVCLKSAGPCPCRNVTVSNCVLGTNCNAIKLGTASAIGFRDITVSNCVIRRASRFEPKRHPQNVIAGVALEIVDGGTMEHVSATNLCMSDVMTPIFIKLGARGKYSGVGRPPGVLKDVVLGDIIARSNSLLCSSITGLPGHDVEDLTLHDIILTGPGGGTVKDAGRAVPENEKHYPENAMFGPTLPASGLYLRHVKNVTLRNILCKSAGPDARPALVCDDVRSLDLGDFQADAPSERALPLVRLIQTDGATIRVGRLRDRVDTFLSVEGEQSREISMMGRGIHAVNAVRTSDGAKPEAVEVESRGNSENSTAKPR